MLVNGVPVWHESIIEIDFGLLCIVSRINFCVIMIKTESVFNKNALKCFICKMSSSFSRSQYVNSYHKSGSTLAPVMACCLMASSHYLNKFWLHFSEVLWHSPKCPSTQFHSECKFTFLLRGQGVNVIREESGLSPLSIIIPQLWYPMQEIDPLCTGSTVDQ